MSRFLTSLSLALVTLALALVLVRRNAPSMSSMSSSPSFDAFVAAKLAAPPPIPGYRLNSSTGAVRKKGLVARENSAAVRELQAAYDAEAHLPVPSARELQGRAIVQLVAALDALESAYALAIDVNGALLVQILEPPPENQHETYEEMLARTAWYRRFDGVLADVGDFVSGYPTVVDHQPSISRRNGTYHADDVLAAGLTAHPGRFRSRKEAKERYPLLAPEVGYSDGMPDNDVVRAEQLRHRAEGYVSHAWRALQREAVQRMLDCLDKFDWEYELTMADRGVLVVCSFDHRHYWEVDEEEYDKAENTFGYCVASSMYVDICQGSGSYVGRRIKRGQDGRYRADDILDAGLSREPLAYPIDQEWLNKLTFNDSDQGDWSNNPEGEAVSDAVTEEEEEE